MMYSNISATSLLKKIQGDGDDGSDEFDSLEEIECYDEMYDYDCETEEMETGKARNQPQEAEEKYDVVVTTAARTKFIERTPCNCPICFETTTNGLRLPYCSHTYCAPCFQSYAKSQIAEASKLRHNVVIVHQCSNRELEMEIHHYGIKCPDPSCRFILSSEQVRASSGEASYQKYQRLVTTLELESIPGFDYCPSCREIALPALLHHRYPYQKCTKCNLGHCKDCGGVPHPNKTCKRANHVYQRNIRAMRLSTIPRHLRPLFEDPMFLENAFNDWMKRTLSVLARCPWCQVMIEKNGGCPNMICTRCNKGFNWLEARSKRIEVQGGISSETKNLYQQWLAYEKKKSK